MGLSYRIKGEGHQGAGLGFRVPIATLLAQIEFAREGCCATWGADNCIVEILEVLALCTVLWIERYGKRVRYVLADYLDHTERAYFDRSRQNLCVAF